MIDEILRSIWNKKNKQGVSFNPIVVATIFLIIYSIKPLIFFVFGEDPYESYSVDRDGEMHFDISYFRTMFYILVIVIIRHTVITTLLKNKKS